ncbi:hypothetical protein BDZ97DRAFT_1783536 [Flammula alnicola]|nr:hypothetical protein BDZ97DRAFT_1783536 [Flammula alnicola]
MPFTDWHSGLPASQVKQEYGFVMSTTVDDLSYTPSEQEKSRDAAQFLATGRKSWKTLKGKGEAVWPPLLEAALLDALEKYQPDTVGPKSDKNLGRFPMRNRFISDYIFETTGKRRTPKQVGSRLQQLRDTCKKDKILQLISHHRNTPEPTSTSSQSEGSQGLPHRHLPRAVPLPPPPVDTKLIYVKISLQSELWPAPIPSIHFVNNDTTNPQFIQLSPSSYPPSGSRSQNKDYSSSILPFLSRSVEFPSPCALTPESTFVVYVNGSNTPVHTEIVPLRCMSSPMQRSGWLYGSDLVPAFWEMLCSSRDITRYTILQTFKPLNSGQTGGVDGIGGGPRGICVVYKFSASEAALRRSSNALPPPHPPAHAIASTTQTLSVPSQASQASPASTILHSAWLLPPESDNLDNNWVQPLRATYGGDNLGMNQPSGNNMSMHYASIQSSRVTSIRKGLNPKYNTSQMEFAPYFQADPDPNSTLYAPIPVQHPQHFSFSYS